MLYNVIYRDVDFLANKMDNRVDGNIINIELFAQRLRDTMRLKNISQTELANRINISTNSVHKIVNGRNLPSLQTYLNICQALNISFGDLLKDSVNEPELPDEIIDADFTLLVNSADSDEKRAVVEILKILKRMQANCK